MEKETVMREAIKFLGRATYSPDDNKLRFYPDVKLSPEDLARVKEAGFKWAPRQELFVAPMWTPDREDLLLEWCGEVEDEDTSLVERAEERADRFQDYSRKRRREADAAHAAVDAIADGIPLGQPILVGHHSERRARRDAEKIHRGMARAVGLWNTSNYWKSRAAGALRAAKYKELPAVRARRIKKLESELRGQHKRLERAKMFIAMWENDKVEFDKKRALTIASLDHVSHCFSLAEYPRELPASQYEGWMSLWSALNDGVITPEQARQIALDTHGRHIPDVLRWTEHYEGRLAYERAMYEESGGIPSDEVKPEKGGAVRCWASPGHSRGWSYIKRVNKVSVSVEDNWGRGGGNFNRVIPFDKIKGVMSAAEVQRARDEGRLHETASGIGFFVDDPSEPIPTPRPQPQEKPEDAQFKGMRESLRQGVKIVSAPNLFPTPPELARRLVRLLGLTTAGRRILEPSAGTGNLVREIFNSATGPDCCRTVAIEQNLELVEQLRQMRQKWVGANESNFEIRCADFLECNGDLGLFHGVVMNPPFDHGEDIRHIKHALTFLKPGGKLAAICANGPKQQAELKPLADVWEELPEDAFKSSGTSVQTAMLLITKGSDENSQSN